MGLILVHVPVAMKGVTALRPTRAAAVGDGLLRLLGPVPVGEVWKFLPGEFIEYEDQLLPGGNRGIVAIRSASRDPEFRLRRRVYAALGFPVGTLATMFLTTRFGYFHPAWVVSWSLLGGLAFSVLSARWGDRAWYGLIRSFAWNWWRPY